MYKPERVCNLSNRWPACSEGEENEMKKSMMLRDINSALEHLRIKASSRKVDGSVVVSRTPERGVSGSSKERDRIKQAEAALIKKLQLQVAKLETLHQGSRAVFLKGDIPTKAGKQCMVFKFFGEELVREQSQEIRAMLDVEALGDAAKQSLYIARWLKDDAFTEHGAICNEFVPFRWADMLAMPRPCALLLRAQAMLLLQTLSTLHKAGIAHGSFCIDKVLLSHGLVPHLVDFSCCSTEGVKQKTPAQLSDLDLRFLPSELRAELKLKQRVEMSLERAKTLDMYAFGASLYLAFFELPQTSLTGLPDLSKLSFKARDLKSFSKSAQRSLEDLINKLLGSEKTRLRADAALRHDFFAGLAASSQPRRHLHLYQALCQQADTAGRDL